jgi:hypothetical protein
MIPDLLKHSDSEQSYIHPGDVIKPCKRVARFESNRKFSGAAIVDEYHLVFPRKDSGGESAVELILSESTLNRLENKLEVLYPGYEKIPHFGPRPLPLIDPILYSIKIKNPPLVHNRSIIHGVEANTVIWKECESFDPLVRKKGWRTSSDWNREHLHRGFSGKAFLLTHGKKWIDQTIPIHEPNRYSVWIRYWADNVKVRFNIGYRQIGTVLQASEGSGWQWNELGSAFLNKGEIQVQIHPISGVVMLDSILFIKDNLYSPEDLVLSIDEKSIYRFTLMQ